MKVIQLIFFSLFIPFAAIIAQQNNFKEFSNIEYLEGSEDTLQRLNLVVPQSTTPTPLLVWIGGGAWSYVNKDMEMDLARKIASQGIAVASIGHRLSPATWRDSSMNKGIQHPAHINDIASAVKWLVDHSASYNFDQQNIFVGGFSSGGHLAALLGLDSTYLSQNGLSSDIIKGIIPISGAYDIVNYHDVFQNGRRPELADLHVKAVFGNTIEGMTAASPSSYLEQLRAPILLMTDNNVYNYTRLFEDRIRETGFRDIQSYYFHDIAHGDLWRNMSYEEKSIYRNLMIEFIQSKIES